MQETDEQAHADYVFALYNGGGWFKAHDSGAEDYVTEQVQYLASISKFWQLRTFSQARVPPQYGSKAYFDRVDRNAPTTFALSTASRSPVPYVAYSYPVGYYALDAAILRLAAMLRPNSISATYFFGRSLGILLLALTLLTSYATLRMLKLSEVASLLLLLGLGLFPLASWVSAYIQPDTLIWLCATLIMYLALRWKEQPFETYRTVALITVVAATFFVKTHYALVLTVTCLLLVAGNLSRPVVALRTRLLIFMAIFAVSLASYVAANMITPVGHLSVPTALSALKLQDGTTPQSPVPKLERIFQIGMLGLVDTYLPGNTFRTFWLSFGDLVSPYIASDAARTRVAIGISLFSIITIALMVMRQINVFLMLIRVGRRRGWVALRLLFNDVALNAYVLWVATLLTAFISSGMQVYLEGRYFLPVLLPTMLLGSRYVPRLIPHRHRRRATVFVALCWSAYSVCMAPLAVSAMESRFYGASTGQTPTRFIRVISINRADTGEGLSSGYVRSAARAVIDVHGIAVSVDSKSPIRSVCAIVDKNRRLAIHITNRRTYAGVSMLNFAFASPSSLLRGSHIINIMPAPYAMRGHSERITIVRY